MYERFHPILKWVTEGDLDIKQIASEDAGDLIRLIEQNRELLMHAQREEGNLTDNDQTQQFILRERAMHNDNRSLCFVVRSRTSLVGLIYLYDIDMRQGAAQVCYWIGGEFQNQGIATRAVLALLDAAFKLYNWQYVYLISEMRNVASTRVAEKIGFKLIGIWENFAYQGRGKRDYFYFELNPSELTKALKNS